MNEKKKRGRIEIDREFCKGCCLCISVCPREMIVTSETSNQKGYFPAEFKSGENTGKTCNACSLCAVICPDVAIEVYRE